MILQKNQLIVVLCVFVSAQKNFFRRCFSTGSDFRAVLGHSEWLGVIFSRSLCSMGSRLLKKASCEYWSSQSLPASTQRAEAFSGRVTGRWKSLLAFSEHKGPFQLRLNDEHCNERYFSHTSNHWRRGHTWMDSGNSSFHFLRDSCSKRSSALRAGSHSEIWTVIWLFLVSFIYLNVPPIPSLLTETLPLPVCCCCLPASGWLPGSCNQAHPGLCVGTGD